MLIWLYFIESNKEYHKLASFLEYKIETLGSYYLIFFDDILCNSGKKFYLHEGLLIAVRFSTLFIDPKEDLIGYGLKGDSLINYYDIAFDRTKFDCVADYVHKEARSFISPNDLFEYLCNYNFRDGSSFVLPDFEVLRCKEFPFPRRNREM